MKRILLTGAAGFIGFHVARLLLRDGFEVVGLDNLNGYYSPALKKSRLSAMPSGNFRFQTLDLADRDAVSALLAVEQFDACVHLAAQAGVRHSLDNPQAYIDSNLVAFANVLEGARNQNWEHLVLASSSSVYGSNDVVPFSVNDRVDSPINLYAATKKANELMAHSYSHLYRIPTTSLRFFTVYGPWGRPDMAVWKFTEAILAGRPIDVYNHGEMERDFTYIDDIADGILKVLLKPPQECGSQAPNRVYNIGNNHPESLKHLIECIESATGIKARKNLLPMQPGDMLCTYADIDSLQADHGFIPKTPLAEGINRFVEWYRSWVSS